MVGAVQGPGITEPDSSWAEEQLRCTDCREPYSAGAGSGWRDAGGPVSGCNRRAGIYIAAAAGIHFQLFPTAGPVFLECGFLGAIPARYGGGASKSSRRAMEPAAGDQHAGVEHRDCVFPDA